MEAMTNFALKQKLSTVHDDESARSFFGGHEDLDPEIAVSRFPSLSPNSMPSSSLRTRTR